MFAIGFAITVPRPVAGLTPPEGFAFVVDENDAYVVDGAGAYVIAEIV